MYSIEISDFRHFRFQVNGLMQKKEKVMWQFCVLLKKGVIAYKKSGLKLLPKLFED